MGTDFKEIVVPCYRIDDLNLDPVGVIKMDAEGHEAAILDGAVKLFERDSPSVLMEADDTRHHTGCVADARAFFEERGYTGFFMLGRQLKSISEFDFGKHQNPDSLDANFFTIFDRVYVDTFAFVKNQEAVRKLTQIAKDGRSL